MLFCLAQVTFNDPVQVYRVLSRALKRFTEDSTLRKKINVPFIRSNCKSCRTYARWQFVLPVMAGSHFAARNLNQMEILPPRAFLFGSSIMALYKKVADAPLPATCAHSCYWKITKCDRDSARTRLPWNADVLTSNVKVHSHIAPNFAGAKSRKRYYTVPHIIK